MVYFWFLLCYNKISSLAYYIFKEGVIMKVNFTARKIVLDDNFKSLAEKKLSKFDRIFGDEAQSYVTVIKEKSWETVEVMVKHRGMLFRAEKSADEKQAAFDEVMDILSRQIRKNKTRLEKKIHSASIAEFFPQESEEETEFNVVKTKTFPVKPMDVEEAILQMNLIGHQFYMFRNAGTNDINVVYKRKDGNYGVLEPEQV